MVTWVSSRCFLLSLTVVFPYGARVWETDSESEPLPLFEEGKVDLPGDLAGRTVDTGSETLVDGGGGHGGSSDDEDRELHFMLLGRTRVVRPLDLMPKKLPGRGLLTVVD